MAPAGKWAVRSPLFLVFALGFLAAPPGTGGAARAEGQASCTFLLFDLSANASFQVDKNGAALATVTSSSMGSASFTDDANTGDRYSFLMLGSNPQPPAPPTGLSAVAGQSACAQIDWLRNQELNVTGYILFYGTSSVALGQATQYDDSLDVGNGTSYLLCGLLEGTYYFALKAVNSFGLKSSFSQEVSAYVSAGQDLDPPVVSALFPPDSAQWVPVNAVVSFHLSDTGAGVDTSSLAVVIAGSAPRSIRISDRGGSGLDVVCLPSALYAPSSTVAVSVSAYDLADPPNGTAVAWSFTTGTAPDTVPPVFCCFDPPRGAQEVARFSPIRATVSDIGSGLDLTSLTMKVNGVKVDFQTEVGNGEVHLIYHNTAGFPAGSTIQVELAACDLSDPANCATVVDYNFSTSAPSSEARAIIVPDGYWARDPTRPLEVRDIPLGWTVRIFNSAGVLVKTFHNRMRDGADWFWDFTNDKGRKVARAVYLIRISDEGGEVRRSGRFLVQKVP